MTEIPWMEMAETKIEQLLKEILYAPEEAQPHPIHESNAQLVILLIILFFQPNELSIEVMVSKLEGKSVMMETHWMEMAAKVIVA